jgi:hypothetical protein
MYQGFTTLSIVYIFEFLFIGYFYLFTFQILSPFMASPLQTLYSLLPWSCSPKIHLWLILLTLFLKNTFSCGFIWPIHLLQPLPSADNVFNKHCFTFMLHFHIPDNLHYSIIDITYEQLHHFQCEYQVSIRDYHPILLE